MSYIRLDDYEARGEIPLDNEEFLCPACKGSHLVFGQFFLRKHLMEHHSWSERAAASYTLYADTPQMRAAVAKRRTDLIKNPEGRYEAKSDRPSEREVAAFLKQKAANEFKRRATELLTRAGVFQGSLEDTLRSLGYNGPASGNPASEGTQQPKPLEEK